MVNLCLQGVDGFLSPSDGVLNGVCNPATGREYGDTSPSFTYYILHNYIKFNNNFLELCSFILWSM
jgi:hypothetical protein